MVLLYPLVALWFLAIPAVLTQAADNCTLDSDTRSGEPFVLPCDTIPSYDECTYSCTYMLTLDALDLPECTDDTSRECACTPAIADRISPRWLNCLRTDCVEADYRYLTEGWNRICRLAGFEGLDFPEYDAPLNTTTTTTTTTTFSGYIYNPHTFSTTTSTTTTTSSTTRTTGGAQSGSGGSGDGDGAVKLSKTTITVIAVVVAALVMAIVALAACICVRRRKSRRTGGRRRRRPAAPPDTRRPGAGGSPALGWGADEFSDLEPAPPAAAAKTPVVRADEPARGWAELEARGGRWDEKRADQPRAAELDPELAEGKHDSHKEHVGVISDWTDEGRPGVLARAQLPDATVEVAVADPVAPTRHPAPSAEMKTPRTKTTKPKDKSLGVVNAQVRGPKLKTQSRRQESEPPRAGEPSAVLRQDQGPKARVRPLFESV